MYCKFFKYARGKTILCDVSKNGVETVSIHFESEKERLGYYRDFCNRPKCVECFIYKKNKEIWENGF